MALVSGGIVLGVICAFGVARLIQRQLHGVSAADAVSFTSVITTVAVLGFLACYVPARRAARVDPVTSLRE
jgi:putative ABC transport system permease protein